MLPRSLPVLKLVYLVYWLQQLLPFSRSLQTFQVHPYNKRMLTVVTLLMRTGLNAIQRINHFPMDKYYQNLLSYPVDDDLFNGEHHLTINTISNIQSSNIIYIIVHALILPARAFDLKSILTYNRHRQNEVWAIESKHRSTLEMNFTEVFSVLKLESL